MWRTLSLTHCCMQLRSQLELAMRTLERGQRREDVDAVESALAAVEASKGATELLADAVKAARKRVEQWQALTASDAKLQRVLRDGASTAQLARAIQEASTAGVKVATAKRTLKVWREQACRGFSGNAAATLSACFAIVTACVQLIQHTPFSPSSHFGSVVSWYLHTHPGGKAPASASCAHSIA